MSANDELAPVTGTPAEEDPEKIRADIERTRAQMSETIGAIQDKLRPEELKHQASQQLHEVKEKLKEELREQIDDLKDKVKEEIREAKDKLREATVGRVETMVHTATDSVENAGGSFIETVKANPIPAALVGIGLTWLFVNRRNARALPRADYRYAEGRDYRFADQRPAGSGDYAYADEVVGADYNPRYGRDDLNADDERGRLGRIQERAGDVAHRVQGAVGEAAQQVGERVKDVTHQVGDRARDVAHRAQDTAADIADRAKGAAQQAKSTASDLALRARERTSDLAERARYGVRQGQYKVQGAYETNPLALGAFALVAGVAFGLALPRTQREDKLLGQTRDKLVHRAQEVAHETMEKVQGAVSEKLQNGVPQNGVGLGNQANASSV